MHHPRHAVVVPLGDGVQALVTILATTHILAYMQYFVGNMERESGMVFFMVVATYIRGPSGNPCSQPISSTGGTASNSAESEDSAEEHCQV